MKVLKYLAIGDSLTFGYGSFFRAGFVEEYRGLAQKRLRKPIKLTKISRIGAESSDILFMIQSSQHIRSLIRRADIITVTAGGNDLLHAGRRYLYDRNIKVLQRALIKSQQSLTQIIRAIKDVKEHHSHKYFIRLINLYNPYPRSNQARYWINQFNQHLKKHTDKNLLVTDVYSAFLGKEKDLLFFDRLHPNSAGYRLMAQQIHRLGYTPL